MPAASPRTPLPTSSPAAPLAPFAGWQWGLVLLATVVAAWLRFLDLGTWSFWVDEAHTWRDATMDLAGGNGFLDSQRSLYPLTFFLLRSLIDFAGLQENEWSMRLPFALVGIATVPLLASCGRQLVGPGAAVLSAWLLALHPWHVFWSQNARGYVLVVLAAVLAADRARELVQTYRVRDAVLLGAAVLLGVISHPTGAMLAIAVVAVFVVRRALRWRLRTRWIAAIVAPLVLWYLPVVAEHFFSDFMKSKRGASTDHFLRTSAFYFRPALLLLAVAGGVLFEPRARLGKLLLASFALAPFAVMLPMSDEVKVTARFAICALPALVWLAAAACTQLAAMLWNNLQVPARGRLLAAAMLPLLFGGELMQQLVDYYTVQHGQRGVWREAADFLRRRFDGAPMRVLTVNHPTMLFYLRPGHWRSQVPAGDEGNHVLPLIRWMWEEGKNEAKQPVHEPGLANHFAWHLQQAKASKAQFAVVVTMPELVEQDRTSGFRVHLAQHFELAAYLPCWIGPKDESIHVYLPKGP